MTRSVKSLPLTRQVLRLNVVLLTEESSLHRHCSVRSNSTHSRRHKKQSVEQTSTPRKLKSRPQMRPRTQPGWR